MAAVSGNGVVIHVGTAGSEPTGSIGEIVGDPSFSIEAGTIEGTKHGDTYKSFIPGLKDPGELSFEMHPADGYGVNSNLGVLKAYKFVSANNGSVWCDGIMTSAELSAPIEDRETWSITIKLSGTPTFAASS